MSKMKKVLLMCTAYVLIAALAIGGTVAYLQDDDSDVNVMTLGNVSIAQHEYERDVDANGDYVVDSSVGGYKLQTFTQNKPLYPATIPTNSAEWTWDSTLAMFEQVGANGGGMNVFVEPNAVDKFVFVENTGKTDAYVRTLIAFESGSLSVEEWKKVVSTSYHFSWGDPVVIGSINVENNNYVVLEYTYEGRPDKGFHENGILPAGEVTQCSLGQVYMRSTATNEDCEAIDGNKNGTYDILVVSQAVQVAGFADAETALNAGFGDITTTNHPWTDGVVVPDKFVSNFDELKDAFAEGGNVLLTDDIAMTELLYVEDGVKVHLNMNGKKMTAAGTIDPDTGFLWVNEGGSLTIDGNGTFDLGANPGLSFIVPKGEVVIENGTFIREVPAGTDPAKVGAMFVGTKVGSLVINGGYFDGGYYDENAEDIEEILAGNATFVETADDIAKRGQPGDANVVRVALKNNVIKNLNMSAANVKVYGGTFVGVNPAWGDEGCMLPTAPDYLRPWSYYQGAFLDGQTFNENGIVLPARYSIAQGTTADGRPTYTVNYNG